MAIAPMAKVVIVTHNTQARELLEALQSEGTCQILNAEEAMVSRDWPDLATTVERPKHLEQLLNRVEKSVAFLKDYAAPQKDIAGILARALAPRTVIDEHQYNKTVSDKAALKIVDRCEQIESAMDKLESRCESLSATLDMLEPWADLETPVEEIGQLTQATAIAGLIPTLHFEQIKQQLGELGAAVQQVSTTNNKCACLVVCLSENSADVQKLLRSADCEQVSFEHMTGTAAELIEHHRRQLKDTTKRLQQEKENARVLAKDLLKLQILYDHHRNLLDREQTRSTAPATECTVVLEGWVRNKDFGRLEETVGKFDASSLARIEPAEDEEVPVEIENNKVVKPFEVITRLYGMPMHFEVDPTAFLAPFFALFFGLCLTDAGYGLIMIAGSVYFIKKMQGDKKFGYLFLICSILTVICGAITGGWFGDAIQLINVPSLNKFRAVFLSYGFDPTKSPMTFFKVALVIGYFQLMFGIAVAFVAKLVRKQVLAAICDHLTWLVMLNCIAAFGFGRSEIFLTPEQGRIFLMIAAVPAATILLLSHREGGIVARLGMGFYNLASTMFYIGDVLSYVRLMALGMVTAGFAMAINQMAMMAWEKKLIGPVIAIGVLIGGHLFNLAISALGSFVHSLRLQYVEFFPKFFEGGGKLFQPFARQYKHVYISNEVNE